MKASQILDREFLEVRAKILEIAASLDRMDRAEGDLTGHPNRQLLGRGIDLLASKDVDRAEQVQLLFSREYVDGWQDDFELKSRT
ncbi:MAG: hypothetical protein VYE64_06825 [Planctomycetota bacterium]|nr:hypothetical protein [Planctomycetota bacterium]